nr:integrase core domain-containing protein [Jeotgalibacillus malaysiensis]
MNERKLPSLDGIVIHTDQGSVFKATEYRILSRKLGFQPSMSRKANCWDNAVIESFFSHLKTEFPYHSDMTSVSKIQQNIQLFIKYYNEKRGQKRLGYLSPALYYQAFLNQNLA